MVKTFWILLLGAVLGFSDSVSDPNKTEELAALKANLYTKIIFLDYDVKKKLVNQKVVFDILYDTPDALKKAQLFAKAAEGRKVMGHEVTVHLVEAGKRHPIDATAYLLLLSNDRLIKEFNRLIDSKRLIFVDSPLNLKYGMITLEVGMRIVPVINSRNLKRSGIQLRPIIFKVAKVRHDQIP